MISLLRVIKFALQDIGRNIGLSFMTVLILVLMLLSVNTLLIINVCTKEAINSIKNQIDVSIYFSNDATQKQIDEVKKYVQSFPEVTQLTVLTADQVLQNFKDQHQDNAEILASLDELGGNPLGATIVLKTRDPGDYKKIISALAVPEYENIIETKTFENTETAINKINTIIKQVEKFGIGLSVLFAVIAFLIIFNTIRVAIYTQRIEIAIKKLVGASNWFIRGPYLIESLVFALFSILVTGGILIGSIAFLDPYVSIVFGKNDILTNYFTSNIMLLFAAQFGAVLILTIISSLLATRKYLRA